MRWLRFKVWVLGWLQRLRLIPRVWHGSEIELARLEAKELGERIGW